MTNSVKMEFKMHHETWAVAFSVILKKRSVLKCVLWDINSNFSKHIVLNFSLKIASLVVWVGWFVLCVVFFPSLE